MNSNQEAADILEEVNEKFKEYQVAKMADAKHNDILNLVSNVNRWLTLLEQAERGDLSARSKLAEEGEQFRQN